MGISELGTSLSVRLRRWPCSKHPIPACIDMLREELRENRTDFSSVGCLSIQTFLCVAYLQRCSYVYMNIHCVIDVCLQTLRYLFIFPVCPISIFSTFFFVCSHTFADSLITTLSPTNSTNPISKAIVTFITQPTTLGDGMLCLITLYGVATICHQVRWLRWGYPSLFHTATSLLIWYKMFCMRDIYHTDLCRWNL